MIQIEAIYFPGYGTKTPNLKTQITNNIKIPNSNDQNISITYSIHCDCSICFEFGISVIRICFSPPWLDLIGVNIIRGGISVKGNKYCRCLSGPG
jgi:hypothetical protein